MPVRPHWEIIACDDDYIPPDYKLSVETRLVKYLRLWDHDPDTVLADGCTVLQAIKNCLEWFICECLAYDPSGRLGDWWSDGVIHLQIEKRADDCFRLLGTTGIGDQGIAPFEIDAVLDPDADSSFRTCIFRIGMLDEHRHPVVCDAGLADARVLEMRPREDRDWAMAVELTPPENR